MAEPTMILLNYTSTGDSGFGGMFALAGGFKATITARLGGLDLEVRGFPLGDGKLYEWGLDLRRLEEHEVPTARYTYVKHPDFVRATGGYGTIPALLAADGSVGCCESNAIARAVARACPRPMLGATPWEHNQVDMFLDKCLVLERDVGPWIDVALFGEEMGFALSDEDIARYRGVLCKWLTAVDAHLAGRRFLVGDGLTVADVVLACQLLVPWCCLVDHEDKASWPNLAAHVRALWSTPEIHHDLGDAVTALTEQYAARRARAERS